AASAVNLGFSDPGHVLLVTTDLSAAGFTDSTGVEAVRQLLQRLRALPGVRHATMATAVPLGFGGRHGGPARRGLCSAPGREHVGRTDARRFGLRGDDGD